SLQRTFKKSFTSFSHSTRNKTRDGLIRVRNIRALNGRFNTSITHAYSIVIGSKHITLNATGGGLDRKSGSAGMPRPISYAVFCLKKKNELDGAKAPADVYVEQLDEEIVTTGSGLKIYPSTPLQS